MIGLFMLVPIMSVWLVVWLVLSKCMHLQHHHKSYPHHVMCLSEVAASLVFLRVGVEDINLKIKNAVIAKMMHGGLASDHSALLP